MDLRRSLQITRDLTILDTEWVLSAVQLHPSRLFPRDSSTANGLGLAQQTEYVMLTAPRGSSSYE
jgi:hypothetical protein